MGEKLDGIGLADALEALRAELAEARAKAAGEDLQFPVQSVTVELRVGVTPIEGGQGGVSRSARRGGDRRFGRL